MDLTSAAVDVADREAEQFGLPETGLDGYGWTTTLEVVKLIGFGP
ncbi:hypothetical protein [Methylobacterium nodulans]|nr:hypothetical protein [Methylobacterium nodulans]